MADEAADPVEVKEGKNIRVVYTEHTVEQQKVSAAFSLGICLVMQYIPCMTCTYIASRVYCPVCPLRPIGLMRVTHLPLFLFPIITAFVGNLRQRLKNPGKERRYHVPKGCS